MQNPSIYALCKTEKGNSGGGVLERTWPTTPRQF